MSYAMHRPRQALGYDMVIHTPIGDQTISLPLEQMTKDLSKQAIDAAWPDVQAKIEAEMPKLLATAEDQALKVMLPKMMPQIESEAQKIVSKTVSDALPAAGAALALVVGSIWLSAYWVRKKR